MRRTRIEHILSALPPLATEEQTFGNRQLRAIPDSCTAASSGRAFPAVSFGYLSVECPFDEFYRINCRPKLGAKLLDRFLHRRRQVSPPVNLKARWRASICDECGSIVSRIIDGSYESPSPPST
jgi:hypothetical protein